MGNKMNKSVGLKIKSTDLKTAALLSLYRCGCPAGRKALRHFMAGRNITNHKQALRVLIKQVSLSVLFIQKYEIWRSL